MSKELLQGLGSIQTNGTTSRLEDGYLFITGTDSAGAWPSATIAYIPIEDCTHTFEWDITYESDAGNYFYIGFERFDINKATGSNNCCIYVINTSNNAKPKQRVKGIINLNQTISASNTNKTAYIRLRILNQWTHSSSTNVTAKIYNISLRELYGDESNTLINKKGQFISDTFWEGYDSTGIKRSQVVYGNQLYEY